LGDGIKAIQGGIEGMRQISTVPFRVIISCGKYEDRSGQAFKNDNGMCYMLTEASDGRIMIESMELPEDTTMLPDIIITLITAEGGTNGSIIAFARLSAVDLIRKG